MESSSDQNQRPVLNIPLLRIEVFLEAIVLLGILFVVFIMTKFYPTLPDIVPTHFDLYGNPDKWGGKESLIVFPVLILGIYVLLTIVSLFPHKFNYLYPITEKNAKEQY
jgi:uncharacterized membrane protein